MLGCILAVTYLFILSPTAQYAFKTKRDKLYNRSLQPVEAQDAPAMVMKLSETINILQWKKIILLFDGESYAIVQELLLHQHLDILPTSFLLQELNPEILSQSGFRAFLQSVHQRFFPELNFILIADYSRANLLLNIVDTADSELNRTTDFRHYSFWIQACTSVCQPPPGPHPGIRHLENVILLSPETENIRVWQLITVPQGRQFSPKERVWEIKMDVFPNMKYGLNKRTLIVSTLENAMFTMKKNTQYVGYCIDLLDSISLALNFSYEIIEPEDGEWGADRNGTWNGLVGQLERREVDMVIAALSIHQDREKVMDFLYPPVFTKVDDIAYKRPIDDDVRWRVFLDSFSFSVLLVLLATLSTFTLLLHFLLKSTRDKSNMLFFIWPYGISDHFLYTFGMLLNRGVGINTRHQPIRLLVFSWGLFSIIVAALYSANLVAIFAVHKNSLPFKDLGELVRQKEYKWGFQSGHIREHIFRLSKGEDMKLAWEGAVEANRTDPDVLSKDILKHFAKLKQGNYAFFESRHTLYELMKNDCSIDIIGQDVIWHQFGLGVPTGYPLRKDIENILSVIADSGLFALWWKRWGVQKPEKCVSEVARPVIYLLDIASAFYLLCSGFGIALFVLLIEMMVKRPSEKECTL